MIDRTHPLLPLTWSWHQRALIAAAAILALLFVCALVCVLLGGSVCVLFLLIVAVVYAVAYLIALLPILAVLGALGAIGASEKDKAEKTGGGCAAVVLLGGLWWFMSWSNWWSNTTGFPSKMTSPLLEWSGAVWTVTTQAAGGCCSAFFTYRVYLLSAFVAVVALSTTGVTLLLMASLRWDRFFCRWFGRIHFHCPRCGQAAPLVCCPQCRTGHEDVAPSRHGLWANLCGCGTALATTRRRQTSLTKICSACKLFLQHPDLGRLPEYHFAVVGAQGSGKTTLLTAALDYLEQEFAPANNLVLTVANTADGKEHYQRVSRLKAQQPLAPTPSTTRPLALMVSLRHRHSGRGCLLYLYDASGTDIQSGAWTGDGVGGHDFHAYIDGVILVVDALAEEGIRRQEQAQTGGRTPLLQPAARDAHYVLGRLLPFWANAQHRKHQERFTFPLAVVVSRLDACRLADSLAGIAALAQKPTTQRAVVRAAEGQSSLIRKLLLDAESNDLIQILESHFRRVCYFGTRIPVGGSPARMPAQHLEAAVPLLWLLDRAGTRRNALVRNCLGRASRCLRGLEGTQAQRAVWAAFAVGVVLAALGLGWLVGFWLGGLLALLLAFGTRGFLIARC